MGQERGSWRRGLRTLQSWYHDIHLRRRLLNIGHLLTGNFIGTLIGFVAFALTARALGPNQYGVLALIYTYTRVIDRLVSFQSWQPLIKYGATLYGTEHRSDLSTLLKLGLLLDVAGALSGWLVAVILAVVAAPLLNWNDETLSLTLLYCTVLLFNINGVPTAVLRMAGRFGLLAYGQVFRAVFRLLLCGFGLLMDGGIWTFAIIWMVMEVFGSLMFLGLALIELRRQGIRNLLGAPLLGLTTRFPGIWNFAWSTNLSLTLRSSAQQFDTLLVGALADPASAGLYDIAKRVGRLAQQVGMQVQAVVYPDLSRLWARQEVSEFRKVVLQVEVILAVFGGVGVLFFFFAAKPLVIWSAGHAFSQAAPLIVVQMIAVTFTLTGTAVRSGLLAMGSQSQVLHIAIVSTLVFHATSLALIPHLAGMGASIGHVLMGAVWMIGLTFAFRRALRKPGEAANAD
jgi:O-antigen/teichoic acid export membrane protein